MKKIVLMLVFLAGFFITANAQAQNRTVRPGRNMERRHHRRRHRRRWHHTSVINPTAAQRSQAVLYKSETNSTI